MGRKPFISKKKKIYLICEGYEEYDYMDKLKVLNKWNDQYEFVLDNAEGNTKIVAKYNSLYSSGTYDCILIFCDTDGTPYETYLDIKRKIDKVHGVENSSKEVVIFGNPCTMQIILSHFEGIALTSHKKEDNRVEIRRLTGIAKYTAKESQRKRLFKLISEENYNEMVKNCERLSLDDTIVPSTNFDVFMHNFSESSSAWIKSINEKLEEE